MLPGRIAISRTSPRMQFAVSEGRRELLKCMRFASAHPAVRRSSTAPRTPTAAHQVASRPAADAGAQLPVAQGAKHRG